jgi:hypothetical protein
MIGLDISVACVGGLQLSRASLPSVGVSRGASKPTALPLLYNIQPLFPFPVTTLPIAVMGYGSFIVSILSSHAH